MTRTTFAAMTLAYTLLVIRWVHGQVWRDCR